MWIVFYASRQENVLMRVPTINEPYHLMASWPTLWLTEKAPAKCHRQAECTCEIIREKRVIHRLIGQSKLLLIANSQVSWTHSHRFQIPHWFLSKTIITTTISTDLKNPKKPQEMILHMFRTCGTKTFLYIALNTICVPHCLKEANQKP